VNGYYGSVNWDFCFEGCILILFIFSMSKIMKCASNDDAITIKAGDDADTVTYMFESPSMFFVLSVSNLSLLLSYF